MKRKLKIITASLLSLAMILSITACGSEGASSDPEVTTNAQYDALVNYLAESGLDQKLDKSIEVTKKIKWMGWWALDETVAAAELFKQVYGIPEENKNGNIFEYTSVAYGDRYDQLGKLIAAGDSPDIFPFEIINFPYSAYKGFFQPVDDYIDLYAPEWEKTRYIMDQFMWGGKNYCAIPQIELDQVMWYRRSVVEEAGLKDPYELYKNDEWTWDAFLDMCDQWQNSGEGRYAVDGWQTPDGLVITTGVPIIGIVDGKLQDNLYNADIERAMTNLIDVLFKENYRYPRHELNGWSINMNDWVKGSTLFMTMEYTAYKDSFQGYIKRYKWENTEIFCVPFPRDPQADAYYQKFKNFCYMLVSGSQNTEGYSAWTQCLIATVDDAETARLSREQAKINYDYSDELLDFFEEMQFGDRLTAVFDFKGGIGSDIVDSNSVYNPVDCLTQIPYINCVDSDNNPVTFTTLRSSNEGIIKDRIDALNASLV